VTASRQTTRRPAGRGVLERTRYLSTRVAVVALVVGALAVAVALDLGGDEATRRGIRATATGPAVPGSDAASATWYCTEGTGSPGGRAEETIWIANVADAAARADITVMPGGDTEPVTRRVTVPGRRQLGVPVSSVVQAAEQPDPTGTIVGPGVVVEVFGGRALVEHEIRTQAEAQADVAVGPCAREPGRNWYFAAGTTERGAEQSVALFNPFADDTILDLQFVTDAGLVAPADLKSLVVPRRSRVTVPLGNFVSRHSAVGAHVRVRTGRVVAEQSLAFTSENETRRGLTLSLGSPAPAPSWMLPDVVSEEGAGNEVYIANFDADATEVEVAVRFEDGSAMAPSAVQIPGRSAQAVDLGPLVGAGTAFAVDVRATQDAPVVAEHLGAWATPAGASGSATALGSSVPARAWAFALTRFTGEDVGTVSVLNPGRRATTVRLLAYSSGDEQPAVESEVSIRGGRQATFNVSELGIAPGQVVVVRADEPVVAARHILLAGGGASLAPGVPDPHAP
jgi:hypothetical protein